MEMNITWDYRNIIDKCLPPFKVQNMAYKVFYLIRNGDLR